MWKADVCVGSSAVLFQRPLVPFCFAFLSPSVAFFHRGISKTTFTCCNSHKLLIGHDELLIESFSRGDGVETGSSVTRTAWLVSEQLRCTTNFTFAIFGQYIQRSRACPCVCRSVFVPDEVSLPVFKVPLQRNATEISQTSWLCSVCRSKIWFAAL